MFRRSLNLLILVYILFKMKIVLYIRCYRSDPDPEKKVPDPDLTNAKKGAI